MQRSDSPGRFIAWWCLVLGLLLSRGAVAAAPDDDPDLPAAGVTARFFAGGANQPAATRVLGEIAARWDHGSPDARVPADGFNARYSGMILIQAPGGHRFFARTDGAVTLRVAGRVVLDGSVPALGSTSIDLPAGFAPFELEYRHQRGAAHLAIDWEGAGFTREPLPGRLLFHERGGAAAAAEDMFEEGRQQADRLGCANCHTLLDLPRHSHLGPPLNDAARAIAPDWLGAWLTDPARLRPHTRMPAFGTGLKPSEVADLTAFLASVGPRPRDVIAEVKMALNVARPERGRLLFRSTGCLGCHTRGDVGGVPEERIAPDLADLGRKRTAAWLAEYLHHSRRGAPSQHRADLRLSPDDAAHLAAYLVTDPPPLALESAAAPAAGAAARGKELAQRLRCAACHEIPSLDAPRADLPLTAGSPAQGGCLADEDGRPAASVPRYALTGRQRQALRALVAQLPRRPAATSPETLAGDTVRRLNCLGCHIRDGQGGSTLGPQLAAALAGDAELGALKGTLTPPNLSAVGDKLRADYLVLAIKGAAPTARPWLSVRMPTFAFEKGEAQAIADFFRGRDRMDDRVDPPPAPTQPAHAAFETAVALIGQRGFGCVNCHVLAGKIPPGGEPETLGPDLALAQRRMSDRFFDRWIRNPQRIIPGTPMPQFLQPVAMVGGTLDDQLSTLWQLLGSTRVADAAAQGTREILTRHGDRAMIVRDMVLLPGAPETQYTPRGLAIGLKNDHALLFDTNRLTWLANWHRGFLSRTKSGRLWEWHPEGDRLWGAARRQPSVVFLDAQARVLMPAQERGRFGHFTEVDFAGADVVLTYALNLPDGEAGNPIEVSETIRPTADGWVRELRLASAAVPARLRPAVLVQVPPGPDGPARDASHFTWKAGSARITLGVQGADPSPATLPDDPTAHLFVLDPRGTARVQLAVPAGG